MIYKKCGGINNRIGGDTKIETAKEIINNPEGDLVMYKKYRMNLKHKLNRNGMSQMFNGGDSEVRYVATHNVHEKDCRRTQQGGTCVLLYGQLIKQHDFEASGKDSPGLGRWVSNVLRRWGWDSDVAGVRLQPRCKLQECHQTINSIGDI